MMRWVVFAIIVVAVTVIATVGSIHLASSGAPQEPNQVADVPFEPTGTLTITSPLTYDSGTMPQKTRSKHDWHVVNTGKGDLRLLRGNTTVECTFVDFPYEEVILRPGKALKITLDWDTKRTVGKYRQSGQLLIQNDPDMKSVWFKVEGTVQPPIYIIPLNNPEN